MQSTLKEYMSPQVAKSLGNLPTWHFYCREASGGINRPGKTARDRRRKSK